MNHLSSFLWVATLAAATAHAAVTPPAGFTALYNGRDLTGWRGGDTLDHRAWQNLPEAERAAAEVLALPVYPELPHAAVATVVEAIAGFYGTRA